MKYIFIAFIIILAILIISLQFIPAGIEPLTELYFENHTKLPANIFLNTNYNFSFTIHNLEYTDMNYSYKLTKEYGDTKLLFDSGQLYLKNNESRTIKSNFSIKENFERAKISIEINKTSEMLKFKNKFWWPDPNYAKTINIHFWVDEIVPIKIIVTPD